VTTKVEVAGNDTFDFDVNTEADIVPFNVTPTDAESYVRLSKTSIVSRTGRQADYDRLAHELDARGCVFLLSGGRLKEMRIPKGLSAMAANVYRQLAASLQMARPATPADAYVANEYDTTGEYVARYDVDRGGVWHKHKEKYVSVLMRSEKSGLELPVVPAVMASGGRVQLLADGRPQSVESQDELAINGGQAPVHARTAVALDAVAFGEQAVDVSVLTPILSSMDRIPATEPYAAPAGVDVLDEARIHGLTFDGVVARFESMHASPNDSQQDPSRGIKSKAEEDERSRLFIALAAIFRRHPETVDRAVQKIRQQSPASIELIDALGSSSSPRAQDALWGLTRSLPPTNRLHDRAIFALSRGSRPGDKEIDALKTVLAREPFNAQALYGLGTAARHLRDNGDTTRMRDIGQFLLVQLSLAEVAPQRVTVLGAIMNSGYVEALPQVSQYIADGPETVRAAAIQALQSMQDPRIDGILASHIEEDTSSKVRVSAIDAARVRQPTDSVAHAVTTAATSDTDPLVRYHAVDLMARWLRRRPELRAALEGIAHDDREERIRSRAQAAL